MTEDEIKSWNPGLDEDYGHRAQIILSGNESPEDWDCLVDHMCSRRCRIPPQIRLHRSLKGSVKIKLNPLAVNLYTFDPSSDNLVSAIRAGFFPYGVPFDCENSDIPKEECGLMTLELAGCLRERKDDQDPGGRLLLEASGRHIPLVVGRKSIKTVAHYPYDSDQPQPGVFRYELRVNSDLDNCWQKIVDLHGIDWCGLNCIRVPLLSLPRLSQSDVRLSSNKVSSSMTEIRLVSLELWDNSSQSLASAEVGYVCGSAYTVLTLFANTVDFPRCDHVRAQAGILHLHRSGITLFDAGTTADYYRKFFGFKKTTRLEFVRAWRRHRERGESKDECEGDGGLRSDEVDYGMMLQGCLDVRGLLEKHICPTETAEMKCKSVHIGIPSTLVDTSVINEVSLEKEPADDTSQLQQDDTSQLQQMQQVHTKKMRKKECTLLISNLPLERNQDDASLKDSILESLSAYGKVSNVRVLGKGKALVVFEDVEAVRNILFPSGGVDAGDSTQEIRKSISVGGELAYVSGAPEVRRSKIGKRKLQEM